MINLKDKLPLIGAAFLLIITIINLVSQNSLINGVISISLFLITIILYFISRRQLIKQREK